MSKCILCGKKINESNHYLGLNCLKKMCQSIGIFNVKNMKGESLLNEKISTLCNKKGLSKKQKELLTDRYLTLKQLNEVPIPTHNNYKRMIQTDIDNISKNNKNKNINLLSFKAITLKQASEINKHYNTYKSTFDKIMNGEYDAIQNISFDVINFAFSRYYNNKPYLSDQLQLL